MEKKVTNFKKFHENFSKAFFDFFITLTKNKNPLETISGFAILFIAFYFLIWGILTAKTNNISGYNLFTNFASIGGLTRGSDVSVNGVKVGSVIETKLNPDDFSVDVMMSIDSRYKFPENTIAKISTYGIIGDKYIKLEIGNDKELLKPNGKIKSVPFKPIEEIIGDLIFKENPKE
ncbi:MAG: MCE family protein [Alphaproteobacteria bacterium]|jgi:phospholipid/cholesterol/gamma-HCH transport system substrate-binding protein|nr:MCE family protein [Alphaproteobacteria bacterium]MBQ8660502.1 MCE family protein [Alphaproteobacteria bacterium]